MNNWKCPICGAINDSQVTAIWCARCGNSKWATMPTFTNEPQNGTYFETKSVCPGCARKDNLLTDMWLFIEPREHFMPQDSYDRLKMRFEQEKMK